MEQSQAIMSSDSMSMMSPFNVSWIPPASSQSVGVGDCDHVRLLATDIGEVSVVEMTPGHLLECIVAALSRRPLVIW